jgi:Zn-finger nucleic acid-binding protein
MQCPECSDPLLTLDAGGIEIDCCFRCSGIWLDTGELRRIEPAALPWTAAAATRTASTAGSCPRCAVALWSHPLAPDPPVPVAECRLCGGLWVATSELARVKRSVEARAIKPPRRPAAQPAARERRRGVALTRRGRGADTGRMLRYPRSLWPLVVAAFAVGMLYTAGLAIEQLSDAAGHESLLGRRRERNEALMGACTVLAQGVAWRHFHCGAARARLAGLGAIALVWLWVVTVYLADGTELPARQERDLTGPELFLLAALTAIHLLLGAVARHVPRHNRLTDDEMRLAAAVDAMPHSVPPPRGRP